MVGGGGGGRTVLYMRDGQGNTEMRRWGVGGGGRGGGGWRANGNVHG